MSASNTDSPATGKSHLPRLSRVTQYLPCPICGRKKYCMLSPLGDIALCTKLESDKRIESLDGWQHFIPASERVPLREIARRTIASSAGSPLRDFSELHESLMLALTPAISEQVANALGIQQQALAAFPLGWNKQSSALAIPAMTGTGQVVGIRYRRLEQRDGQHKWWCESGSRWYPLLPIATVAGDQPLFVTEGPSDCLAATHLGLSSCGRWAKDLNQETAQVILDHSRAIAASAIVVCGDNDPSGGGEVAALRVAQLLQELAPTFNIKTIQPPDGIKDIREWVHRGATASLVLQTIRNLEQ